VAENSKAVVGPLSVSQTIASAGTNSLSANIVSTGANFNFEVRANVCSGVANVRGKTLSAKIYLQGPALPNNDEEYLALEVWTTSAAFFPEMTRITPVVNTWMTLTAPLTDATKEQFNGAGVFLYLPADANGSWIGKVFVDDIRID
jgi:hypothetical protein